VTDTENNDTIERKRLQKLIRLEIARDRDAARKGLRGARRINFTFTGNARDKPAVNHWYQVNHGCSFNEFVQRLWNTAARDIPKPHRVTEEYLSTLDPVELFYARFLPQDREWVETIIGMAKYIEPGDFLSTGDICDSCEYPADAYERSRPALVGVGRVMKLLKPRWTRHKIKRGDKWIWAYKKPVGMFFPEGYKK
jgi:hypothetical protein